MTEKGDMQAVLATKNGYYYGTTKGNSWWRRYTKGGWFMRGNSEVWIEASDICFRRYLSRKIFKIPFEDIRDVTLGKWHAGKYAGAPVIKIAFMIEGESVVAGFSISRKKQETLKWMEIIQETRNSHVK